VEPIPHTRDDDFLIRATSGSFENPDESNVELPRPPVIYYLKRKHRMGADGNLHRSEGFFKAMEKL
jgi:hypothetical protein